MNRIFKHVLMMTAAFGLCAQHVLAQGSEFIEDMPELSQDPDRAGAMIWEKPGLDRGAYKYVLIEPVEVFVSPDSDYKGLNADELKALADGFREALTSTLAPEITVVDKASPGVLYLRAALSNVKLKKKKRGLLGYTPVGIVVTAAKDAAGARISVKDAVLEIEMLDAATQERLGVLVDKAPTTAAEQELSWKSIEQSFTYYAGRFKSRMQAPKTAP